MNIQFEKASLVHKDTILKWLGKPHVKEFWANSQEHRDDILRFLGRENKSMPYEGIFTYWIGYLGDKP